MKKVIEINDGNNLLIVNIELDKHFSVTGEYYIPVEKELEDLGMSRKKAEKEGFLYDLAYKNDKEYLMVTGGCIHDQILELAPELAPVIKMHLSDLDTGKPFYAYENGRYWYSQDKEKGLKYLRAENVEFDDDYFDTIFVKMLPIWKKEADNVLNFINGL